MKIEVMYFGRPSEYLQIISERIDLPDEKASLKQVLNRLRNRGIRRSYELDESHLVCTLNQNLAAMSDTIEDCDEIAIFSRKSSFEI